MRFIINSASFDATKESVEAEMEFQRPEPVRYYWIIINRKLYPPNQILECITGLPRVECNTGYSVTILKRLGFKIHHYIKERR